MTRYDVVKRLAVYDAELRGILSRFVHTRGSISISSDDRARLEPIVIELRDLFTDFLGPNDYSKMVVNAYNDGIGNFFHSPSHDCVERLIGIISAASVRIENNPDLGNRTPTDEAPAKRTPLENPEKVTLRCLFNHVPISMWLMIAGMLIASFTLGISAAKLSIVQEWFNITIGPPHNGKP
jgi:hypothetical protein